MKKLAIFGGIVASFVMIAILFVFFIGKGTRDGVGLVEVKGMIVDSQETIRLLEECRKNRHIRAVVLRVDSPGGVVAPAQEIFDEVRKLAAVKKVIVSMGAVAAS